MTVVILYFVTCFRHLLLKQRLHCCGVWYDVSIEDDDGQRLSIRHIGCGHVKGCYVGSRGVKRRIIGVDEAFCGWFAHAGQLMGSDLSI